MKEQVEEKEPRPTYEEVEEIALEFCNARASVWGEKDACVRADEVYDKWMKKKDLVYFPEQVCGWKHENVLCYIQFLLSRNPGLEYRTGSVWLIPVGNNRFFECGHFYLLSHPIKVLKALENLYGPFQ